MRRHIIADKNGFTLIELLVVVAILALLAGLAAPKLLGVFETAKSDSGDGEVGLVQVAVDQYVLAQEKLGKEQYEIWNLLTADTKTALTFTGSEAARNLAGVHNTYLKKAPTTTYKVNGKFTVSK